MTNEEAVQEYQCSGCVNGPYPGCFQKAYLGIGCSKHCPGTRLMPGGRIFLGMPKGFNRLGPLEDMKLWVYSGVDESVHEINMFNVAVWKHLDEHGNTLIRGYRPRTNTPFLWVILGNHMDRFECREITKEEVAEMD